LKVVINFKCGEASVILCLCEGVSDRVLRSAVRDGACSVGALARRTGAGTGCGSCACDLKRLIAEEGPSATARADREPGMALAAK
jgi:bacterioferritin-associated ferredoxin